VVVDGTTIAWSAAILSGITAAEIVKAVGIAVTKWKADKDDFDASLRCIRPAADELVTMRKRDRRRYVPARRATPHAE